MFATMLTQQPTDFWQTMFFLRLKAFARKTSTLENFKLKFFNEQPLPKKNSRKHFLTKFWALVWEAFWLKKILLNNEPGLYLFSIWTRFIFTLLQNGDLDSRVPDGFSSFLHCYFWGLLILQGVRVGTSRLLDVNTVFDAVLTEPVISWLMMA